MSRPVAVGWMVAAVLLAAAAGPTAAQIQFQASVDRRQTSEQEPIHLVLSVQSVENITRVPAPEIALGDFHVEGPAVSTQVQMVNFATTYGRDYTYTLYPKRAGTFTLGPARLTHSGRVYQTQPIQVTVVAGAASRAPTPTRPGGQAAPGTADPPAADDVLFVRARTDRRQAYVGQQVTLSYDLVYRVPLANVGFRELPSFAGFWAKELFAAQQLNARREQIRGVLYNAAPLRQMALFPTTAGRQRIDPLAVSCDVPDRSAGFGSPFQQLLDDPFFGGGTRTVLVRSDPVTIDALPLPEAGRPAEFTGAVGDFTLAARAEPAEVQVGDPVTLRVEISGQGNLETVKAPPVSAAGFKVYDPKLTEEPRSDDTRVGGRRVWEYILLPDRGGQLQVPSVRFAWFDPDRGQYRQAASPSTTVRVRGSAAPAGPANVASRTDLEPVGQDIRHIKPDLDRLQQPLDLAGSWAYWSGLIAMPACLAGFVLYRRHQQRLQGDVAYARRRRARGRASSRLRRANQLLAANQPAEFHAEVQRALLAFLADRLNLPEARLTPDLAAEALQEHGIDPEVTERLRALLVQCEFVRFAPPTNAAATMDEALEQAGRLLAELETRI